MTIRAVFGIDFDLTRREVDALVDDLSIALTVQSSSAGITIEDPTGLERDAVAAEITKFRTWFDPTAKGERLRSLLARLDRAPISNRVQFSSEVALDVGGGRWLVTPEGFLAMWVLSTSQQRHDDETSIGVVRIDDADLGDASEVLLGLYRGWTRRRLDDVVGLLTSETSTLRPAAAGLLLTLLINRNTSSDRALRRPRDADQLQRVAAAVASPALAYAEGLSGRKTATSSVDLYRGWALGELRRRLGAQFHSHLDKGIWLDEAAEPHAMERLIADVRRRDARGRARVGPALEAATKAYEEQRPLLAALNLAFERPANTERIRQALEQAATE